MTKNLPFKHWSVLISQYSITLYSTLLIFSVFAFHFCNFRPISDCLFIFVRKAIILGISFIPNFELMMIEPREPFNSTCREKLRSITVSVSVKLLRNNNEFDRKSFLVAFCVLLAYRQKFSFLFFIFDKKSSWQKKSFHVKSYAIAKFIRMWVQKPPHQNVNKMYINKCGW